MMTTSIFILAETFRRTILLAAHILNNKSTRRIMSSVKNILDKFTQTKYFPYISGRK